MEETINKKTPLRYITRLRMENFQSHKDTDIDFTDGINLIVGSSDAGKSAILRAINFVFHNQPRNKAFVRMGSDETRVSIWFSDGTEVQRIKGERNCIIITVPGEDPQIFEKIGHELPPEAIKALGAPPIDDKHGPLSFSEQMSPYFLVSLSPTDLPRSISELTGISHFEEAAQSLGKEARQADRQAGRHLLHTLFWHLADSLVGTGGGGSCRVAAHRPRSGRLCRPCHLQCAI